MSKSKDYQNIGSNILWIFTGLLIIYIIYGSLCIFNDSYDSNIILYLTAIVSIIFFIYLLISTNAMLQMSYYVEKVNQEKHLFL